MSKVSFVIPAYNAEAFVAECMDHIRAKAPPSYEIVVVNDGSRDRTREVCEDYIKAHPETAIRLINQENAGVSVARNNGVAAATGDWIVFVDADDALVGSLSELLAAVDTADADLVLCRYTREMHAEKDGTVSPRSIDAGLLLRCLLRYPKYYKAVQETYLVDPYCNWACWAKLFRRTWLTENRVTFPEGIFTSEDCVFLLRAYAKQPRILVTDFLMYYYRVNEQSVTHTFNPRILDNYSKVFDCIERSLQDEALRADVDAYVVERVVECARRYDAAKEGGIDREHLTALVSHFVSEGRREQLLRAARTKIFIGKKNRLFGAYWLLRIKRICKKMKI